VDYKHWIPETDKFCIISFDDIEINPKLQLYKSKIYGCSSILNHSDFLKKDYNEIIEEMGCKITQFFLM